MAALMSLVPSACHGPSQPAPTNLPSAPKLGEASDARLSRISASAEATELANSHNPDGPAKTAVFESNSVVRKLAGPATESDRLEAIKLVNSALNGKLNEALTGWAKARGDAEALNARIQSLEQQVAAEKERAKAEMAAKIKEIQDEAAKERKRWIMLSTIGLGALALAAGVVMLVAGSQYPFLGPRMAFATMGGGITLIATGIAVNAIERALEAHPWIIYSGIGLAFAFALVAGALGYSNHRHHVTPEGK